MSFPDDHLHLETVCHRIADGRRLARQLASAVRKHEISEAEFRLLWLLCEKEQPSFEQSQLVKELGSSPAQVSAIVEKLRSQQIITSATDRNDRRRKHWQLTASGRERFESIVATVGLLSREWVNSESIAIDSRSQLGDAA